MYRKSRLGGGSRFFNLKRHTLHQDGVLTIKASGYEENCEHWTGWLTVTSTEADYDFWYWMACIRQPPEIVPERELESWKREYAASRKEFAGAVLAK